MIDAEYVVVTPDSPLQPPLWKNRVKEPAPEMPVATLAESRKRGGIAFWSGAIAAIAGAFWLSGGYSLFAVPDIDTTPTASLRISGWTSKVSDSGQRPVLLIDGEIVNQGQGAAQVPPLQIEVSSPGGASTRYKLGTGDVSIDADATFPFSGRLHLPTNGVEAVSVSFVQ